MKVKGSVLAEMSYDEYLENFIDRDDLFYLDDELMAREIIQLGIKRGNELLTREQFEERKNNLSVKVKPSQSPNQSSYQHSSSTNSSSGGGVDSGNIPNGSSEEQMR